LSDQGDEVVIIDRNDYFFHLTRSVESLLSDEVVPVMFEYKRFLAKRPNLNFFQAEGKCFDQDGSGLTIRCGETQIDLKRRGKGSVVGPTIDLPLYMTRIIASGYKKVILSSGAPTPLAMVPRETSFIIATKKWTELKDKMRAVKNMIVVGGGAVSTEMAGYASDAKPDKVTLCCRSSQLFSDLPVSFQSTANSQFKKMLGDKFHLERVPEKEYKRDKDFPNFVFFGRTP